MSKGAVFAAKPAEKKRTAIYLKDFDPNQPRADDGKWTSGGGGAGADKGPADKAPAGDPYNDDQYLHSDGKYHVGDDVDAAARLISQEKDVVLDQPREVSALLDRLAAIGAQAASGEKKVYDLCRVSVPGTNLFCSESKGFPRAQMPQLAGKPLPGSPADKLPKDAGGGVDLTDDFVRDLGKQGYAIERTREDAGYLRATQRELDGVKVAAIMKKMEEGGLEGGTALLVSRDNYIIDGHHRWAAKVALSYAAQVKIDLPVQRVDIDVIDLLDKSRAYADKVGIPQRAVGKSMPKKDDCGCRKSTPCGCGGSAKKGSVYLSFEEDKHPRDDHGRFSSGGGSSATQTSDEAPFTDPYIQSMRNSTEYGEAAEDFQSVYDGMQKTQPGPIISWDETPDSALIPMIAANGQSFDTKGRTFIKGADHECHRNASQLYIDGKVDNIATGYAFAHGLWFRHSWGLKGGNVVETTQPFESYYGAPMRPAMARIWSKLQVSE